MANDRTGLDDVLEEARREPKQTWIRFRSPIAAHGEDAVEPIRAWLTDPELGAFAVRVLEEVARAGSRTAVTALQWGRSGASDTTLRDIDEALDRLGVRRGMSKGIASTAELHRSEEPSGSRVWLLRMVPVGEDRVGEARAAGVITIGWGKADGLTDPGLSRDRFRDEVVRPLARPMYAL